MTNAVASAAKRNIGIPIVIGAFLVVAALIGAALYQRGPDQVFAPQMAEQPLVFPDGTSLYVQKYEVTVGEWNACYVAGVCTLELRVPGTLDPTAIPATGLSYMDVSEYLGWINGVSRMDYRLPTVSEWKFMAAEVLPQAPDPVFTDPDLTWASAYLLEPQTNRALRPKGSFATTSTGIVDLDGSVWEWTQDCYAGATAENSSPDRCPAYLVAGEHISVMSFLVRDPARGGCAVGAPPAHLGMRLVSERRL